MTLQTLKKLIENHIDSNYANNEFKDELKLDIMFFINLYEEEQMPNYVRPVTIPPYGTGTVSSVPDKVPYHTICGCNPDKGGSGLCGCTMANQMVENPAKVVITTY